MSLNQDQRAYRATEWYKENHRRWEKEYRRRKPELALWQSCKKRARRSGLEFSLIPEDIVIPERCPILDIPIVYGGENRSNGPSVDRVNTKRGYTKDNTCVVSFKANSMKSDMTLEQARRLLELMEKYHV